MENFFNCIKVGLKTQLFFAFFIFFGGFSAATLAQDELDEQVPYRGDTLLINPNQVRETADGDVLMDCDWPTMMSMIRDLEERIAFETETDTVYGLYVSGGMVGNTLNMWHDCLVLRDSIVSLQVTYDEALAPRVTVDAAVILSDSSAALSASFSGSGISASGFKWSTDADMTSTIAGDATGVTSPIVDTLTTLDRGKTYYFTAFATKDNEDFYGDTLSLLTLPGITSDSADAATETSVTLNATFSADSITAQGFVWGEQANLSDGESVPADTTGGSTAIEYVLTGLTGGTVGFFSAFATNASGTSYGDTVSFSTWTNCGDPYAYDDYTYATVLIVDQCWFAENLRSEKYNNGEEITTDIDQNAWRDASEGAVAVFNQGQGDADTNLDQYGRLYNWYAVDDASGLCPTGWHVPDDAEFLTLEIELGMPSEIASTSGWRGAIAEVLKSTEEDDPSWNGTNTSGFSAVPAGYRSDQGGFNGEGAYAGFWTSSANDDDEACRRLLDAGATVQRNFNYKTLGLSVRCIKTQE